MSNLIGTNADQVPTCGMLGTAAFMDASQITALGTASLLTSITPTNGVTSVSLTSLKPYNLLRIVAINVGPTYSNARVTISSDNGSTYSTEVGLLSPGGAAASFGWIDIMGAAVVGNKTAQGGNMNSILISSVTGVINAIKVAPVSGTFDGTGNIYIYGIN
jgi:hypothetical protein